MPVYRAPVRDYSFIVNELINFEQYRQDLGFEDADPDTINAIFEESARMAEEVFQPLNQSGDEQGCKLESAAVTTPTGFQAAYKQYCESGWSSLTIDEKWGGQGMPHTITLLVGEGFAAANHALYLYNHLTHSAHAAIASWGSEDLQQKYLPKMTSGEWTGTMNLTESHSGSDLGIIRTKAEAAGDGSYRISGSKIFITAGEHDLSENIIHLVLAKLPGAPAGTRGISLFVVPKFLVNDDGSLGERNGVSCSAIEHKMGLKGSATCVLDYDNAIGYMVGEENKGLRAMFTMMNIARLSVAMEGLGKVEVSYQNAVAYAQDRLQGRAVTGAQQPDKPADPIIVHPDVRRMLMTMRCFSEGARALAAQVALSEDISHHGKDADQRATAADHVALLTPVLKALYTDEGSAAANLAVQVYGGHGFIAEHGVEQFVRDARICQLYEGTNGIQAMDLVTRKVLSAGGRMANAWFAQQAEMLASHAGNAEMAKFVAPAQEALSSLQAGTAWLNERHAQAATSSTATDDIGAAAVEYLRLFGITAIACTWVEIAAVCLDKLQAGTDESEFYRQKLIVGRFYMERYASEHSALLSKMRFGSETMMALAADAF